MCRLRFLHLVALAALATGCSGERDSEAAHLPLQVQRQLPLDVSLGNLCPGAETPPDLARDLRRRAEALLRELRVHPDFLVTYTFFTEEEGPQRESITVREVAERQLDDLRSGGSDLGECVPVLQQKLETALSPVPQPFALLPALWVSLALRPKD
jgi:hypothetical protein